MSQYAYGKLGVYRLAGKQLPYPGGFDKDGNLTSDPGAIEDSKRILPTGYWKGSGMALALDMAAALMANGKCGTDMDNENRGSCTGCCQIFIAYDPCLLYTSNYACMYCGRYGYRLWETQKKKPGGSFTGKMCFSDVCYSRHCSCFVYDFSLG